MQKITINNFSYILHILVQYKLMAYKLPNSSSTVNKINVNKFHYGIYTYVECKSQNIYTHNINLNPNPCGSYSTTQPKLA